MVVSYHRGSGQDTHMSAVGLGGVFVPVCQCSVRGICKAPLSWESEWYFDWQSKPMDYITLVSPHATVSGSRFSHPTASHLTTLGTFQVVIGIWKASSATRATQWVDTITPEYISLTDRQWIAFFDIEYTPNQSTAKHKSGFRVEIVLRIQVDLLLLGRVGSINRGCYRCLMAWWLIALLLSRSSYPCVIINPGVEETAAYVYKQNMERCIQLLRNTYLESTSWRRQLDQG